MAFWEERLQQQQPVQRRYPARPWHQVRVRKPRRLAPSGRGEKRSQHALRLGQIRHVLNFIVDRGGRRTLCRSRDCALISLLGYTDLKLPQVLTMRAQGVLSLELPREAWFHIYGWMHYRMQFDSLPPYQDAPALCTIRPPFGRSLDPGNVRTSLLRAGKKSGLLRSVTVSSLYRADVYRDDPALKRIPAPTGRNIPTSPLP